MTARAHDPETAQLVIDAVNLARCGASAAVIERVSGFGKRWARSVVKSNGGPLARRLRYPRWFESDQDRLLQGRFIVMMYEQQRANRSPAVRLREAYLAYREVVHPPGVLDINDCAQLIELYQSGNAWNRCCVTCAETYLIFYERQPCPVCRFKQKAFCRKCGCALEKVSSVAYCDPCALTIPRVASRRRDFKVDLSVVLPDRHEQVREVEAARRSAPQ